jgi:amino-acid N-acetyltransferase
MGSDTEPIGEELVYLESTVDNAPMIFEFLQPFVAAKQLLERTAEEIAHLTKHGFMTMADNRLVGFACVEVYSRKLAEVQCLAVAPEFRNRGIGRNLVKRCLGRARELGVVELMAISASEKLFTDCGFDYSLPNQKRALFIQPLTCDPVDFY